jgi:hypothetical protein
MRLLSPIMAPNTTRNAGRQLLVTRNRLRTEKSAAKIASLKRLEAILFLELGQKDAAVAVATSLAEENSDGSSGRAFLADILARAFLWQEAEHEFINAHRLCVNSGNEEKAFSLAAGPLFLLAEAREDYSRCAEIAPIEVLLHRALRLAGHTSQPVTVPEKSPWREIALLEKVHLGANPSALPELLAGWSCGEAEWRWRILYEGAVLAMQEGTSAKPWKRYLKQTGTKVLDPRYFRERGVLKRLLRRGFVHS